VVYLLIVERGLRAALAVADSFGKLVAGGLAFTLAGSLRHRGWHHRTDPADGQTTPFMTPVIRR
jgi:cell division protein FtsW (lipid II flippase)